MTPVLLAALLLGGGAPSPAASPSPAAPRLSVEPESFDFGATLPGRSLTKEFSLRNVGGAELVIDKLSTSCACTAYLLDEKDRRLAPGRRVTLRVTLTTPRTPGHVAESVRIASNDTSREFWEVRVEATVRAGNR